MAITKVAMNYKSRGVVLSIRGEPTVLYDQAAVDAAVAAAVAAECERWRGWCLSQENHQRMLEEITGSGVEHGAALAYANVAYQIALAGASRD
jgi:hypothetical protein